MRCVAMYRRSGELMNQVNIIKNARIRQVASAYEIGLTKNRNNFNTFIEIDRIGYGYDYYSASAYRALEVEIDE